MRIRVLFVLFFALIVHPQIIAAQPLWKLQESGSNASLRGLCVVTEKIVWASGTEGTVLRTVDGGETWKDVSVRSAGELDFRDIHAFGRDKAVVLSAGQPARVYLTENGGKSWRATFEHPDKNSFFDALSFWDDKNGIAMSDPIDGRILLIETTDGGESWSELESSRRPVAERGEGGFAASGTNMVLDGKRCLIALGSAEKDQTEKNSRIIYTQDKGQSWQAALVPMLRDPSSGIFSLAIQGKNGVAVGGDYTNAERDSDNCAVSIDRGKTWEKPAGKPPRGFRSCVAFAKFDGNSVVVAVGPDGTDVSHDNGMNWKPASNHGFHAVQFTSDGIYGWASGPEGRIAKWLDK